MNEFVEWNGMPQLNEHIECKRIVTNTVRICPGEAQEPGEPSRLPDLARAPRGAAELDPAESFH